VPIYEFYCDRCNTIYKFFSRRVNTEKIPDCPECRDVRLKRRVSLFATVSRDRSEGGAGVPDFDEKRVEKALASLAGEAERLNEDDPRQAAHLMRRLTEATGLKMGRGMEEALRRLERGEDPEKIEEEMGDIFDEEEPFTFEERQRGRMKRPSPRVDETLYEL
jgi:putative FmdB family regulatory protein